MRLLLDENLSFRLVDLLSTDFPRSAHVTGLGLRGASDAAIWEHARANGYFIVSKDDDFRQRSFMEGPPPKVNWLAVGNAGTVAIAALLQREAPRIEAFGRDPDSALLVTGESLRLT